VLPFSGETISQNVWRRSFLRGYNKSGSKGFPALITPKTQYRVSKTLITESFINDLQNLRYMLQIFSNYYKGNFRTVIAANSEKDVKGC
jgi:intein/homing endonuclease